MNQALTDNLGWIILGCILAVLLFKAIVIILEAWQSRTQEVELVGGPCDGDRVHVARNEWTVVQFGNVYRRTDWNKFSYTGITQTPKSNLSDVFQSTL